MKGALVVVAGIALAIALLGAGFAVGRSTADTTVEFPHKEKPPHRGVDWKKLGEQACAELPDPPPACRG